jgi:hypothetical protein
MDPGNRDCQATEKKLSEQFVEFIDLTDEDLKEVDILELGVHGGSFDGDYAGHCRSCGCHCGCGCRGRSHCSGCGCGCGCSRVDY